MTSSFLLPEEIGTKKKKKYVTLTMSITKNSKMLAVLDAVRGSNSRSLVIRAVVEYAMNQPSTVQAIVESYKIQSQQNVIQEKTKPDQVQ